LDWLQIVKSNYQTNRKFPQQNILGPSIESEKQNFKTHEFYQFLKDTFITTHEIR